VTNASYSVDEASQGIPVQGGQTLRISVRVPVKAIAAKINTRGGTPLVRHQVQVIDPDTGEPVSDPIATDDQGRVVVEVPDDRGYHIRILDDDPGDARHHEAVGYDPTEDHIVLSVRLISATGSPVGHESWTATGPGGSFTGTTDDNGCLAVDNIEHGVYLVGVRGRTYKVHTLRTSDFPGDNVAPSKLVLS
jgi:hypothetical protein